MLRQCCIYAHVSVHENINSYLQAGVYALWIFKHTVQPVSMLKINETQALNYRSIESFVFYKFPQSPNEIIFNVIPFLHFATELRVIILIKH